jgi:hypothetical protein
VLAARTADIVGGPPNTTMASRFTGMGVLCHRERPRDNWPDYTGRSLGVAIRLLPSLPRVGRTASAAAHACLTNCPWGRLRLLEGLKVRRAGLAGDARGGQGIARGRVRLADLELIVVGVALARVMLAAPLLP